MIKESVKNILFNLKKNKSTFSPVFIIGCGRSGTTILGNTLSKNSFTDLGNEGLLALIGDSTNADVPGYSGSENEVREELQQIFARYINRIVVTCFSSNIARIINIVNAAKKNNRNNK